MPVPRSTPALPEGTVLGSSATVVQFSSAFCQPCRATRRTVRAVVDDMAATGVAIIDVDADENLDVARAWNISSTPTLVFLDADGCEVHRGSGQPRRVDVIAGLGRAIG